jgi:glycogen synthase
MVGVFAGGQTGSNGATLTTLALAFTTPARPSFRLTFLHTNTQTPNPPKDAYYNDKAWFRGLQARIMGHDVSWCRPAAQYIDLYYAAIKK